MDYNEWSPQQDKHLQSDGYVNYNKDTLREGKARCKEALQRVRCPAQLLLCSTWISLFDAPSRVCSGCTALPRCHCVRPRRFLLMSMPCMLETDMPHYPDLEPF